MILVAAVLFLGDKPTEKPTEIWAAVVAAIVSLLICLLQGLWLNGKAKKLELSNATILETVRNRLDQAKTEALAELNKGLAEEMEVFKKQLEVHFLEADKRKEALVLAAHPLRCFATFPGALYDELQKLLRFRYRLIKSWVDHAGSPRGVESPGKKRCPVAKSFNTLPFFSPEHKEKGCSVKAAARISRTLPFMASPPRTC